MLKSDVDKRPDSKVLSPQPSSHMALPGSLQSLGHRADRSVKLARELSA